MDAGVIASVIAATLVTALFMHIRAADKNKFVGAASTLLFCPPA